MFTSPYGYTHADRDKKEMCPYCYNEDTQRIVDNLDLKKYLEYYGHKKFKVFSCYCCNGLFHFLACD